MPAGRPKKVAHVEAPLQNFEGTKREQLRQLYAQWDTCQRCPLAQVRETQEIVFANGNPESAIMIVGEAPGQEEQQHGIPFVGESGKLLNQILASVSDDPEIQKLWTWYNTVNHTKENSLEFHEQVFAWRDRTFFLTNVVGCRPPDNRNPIPPEIRPCWERLHNLIYIVQPKLIFAMGKVAYQTITKSKKGITDARGNFHDAFVTGKVRDKVTFSVMPVFHPSYLLRKADWNQKVGGDFRQTKHDFYEGLTTVDALLNKEYSTPIPHREKPE